MGGVAISPCCWSQPTAAPLELAQSELQDASARAAGRASSKRGEDQQSKERLGTKWVRIVRDKDDEPLSMETAIVRYVPAEAVELSKSPGDYPLYVDLVGAVHIGDKAYYAQLNQRFRKYDAVLYELVAPEGTVVPLGRGSSNAHPLGALQNGMKSMLEVEHQLEQIDYTQPNFVHADLSPEKFLESMERRDETFIQMYFRMLGASLAEQGRQSVHGESAELDIMAALFAEDRARKLKIALAKQFEGMESLMVGLSGVDGSTLITERNNKALDVLENQLNEKQAGRFAIFYGAGHLAEMHASMEQRFGYRAVAIEWVEAWDLRE